MEVHLSSEQRAFATSTDALASDLASTWSQGRGPDDAPASFADEKVWRRIADAGWLAVRVAEEGGGAGGTCVDVCVLVEQVGRHALPVPVVGALIALEQLQLRGADPALLESIVNGNRRVAPLFEASLLDFATNSTDAIAVDSSGASTGFVLGAAPAEVSLGPSSPTADLTREKARPFGTSTPRGLAIRSEEIRARELAFTMTVLSADLLGLMSTALEHALEHAQMREQFGRPIGSFQAIKHLLAEAHVSVEATRSAVWYAAWAVDSLEPSEALRVARTAKAYASSRAVEVVETALQTFGGIGMTWESSVHVWQRRLHLDRRILGDEFVQYAALARQ